MRTINFLFAAAVGALGYHIWLQSTKRGANKALTMEEKASIVAEVINDESQKYSDILKKQYDIIMPSDRVSAKVQAKAKQLTKGRYEVDLNKVKEPVKI